MRRPCVACQASSHIGKPATTLLREMRGTSHARATAVATRPGRADGGAAAADADAVSAETRRAQSVSSHS
eukprot:4164397-Prymnesium_polylepis.2